MPLKESEIPSLAKPTLFPVFLLCFLFARPAFSPRCFLFLLGRVIINGTWISSFGVWQRRYRQWATDSSSSSFYSSPERILTGSMWAICASKYLLFPNAFTKGHFAVIFLFTEVSKYLVQIPISIEQSCP